MRRLILCLVLTPAAALLAGPVVAAPVLMANDWAAQACAAWNKDPILTTKLVESGWTKNDKGRGFKVLQVYREDCPKSPRIELRIALKDGKATCVYGGKAETAPLAPDADYVMYAEMAHWKEMGEGAYGPMRAMMFGRLHFSGPMLEAMGNMGPFESFLLLVGKVPADLATCPAG
ncbi:MAG: SCP2 sterol-binding domain-containing protein [Burkholderiales bacterium]|nr:SCP2 sterol-binding domain-containing protein [Burkholderiales bacterium]